MAITACAGPQILGPGPGPTIAHIEADGRAFVARDGYRLRWSVWSAAQPRGVIVALHGMNDYGETYQGAAEYWASRGYTTYAYDQRGFGRTLGDGIWPGTQALIADVRDAVRLVQAKYSGLPVYLVGESMGGAVALAALGDPHAPPVAAAALLAPGLQGWSRLSVFERAGLWFIANVTPSEPLTSRGLNLKPSDNTQQLQRMAADPFVLKRVRADAFYGLVRLMDDATATAARVTTPLLVVFGGRDNIAPIGPARELARENSHVTLKFYPDEYHLLMYGPARQKVFQDVLDHFERLPNTTHN